MADKRMIDADTLLETIHDTADGLADCDQQNAAWALRKYAVRDIMGAPTVDAVEVVRCKDCIHYDFGVCLKIYSDGAASQYAWQARNEDDFCSYGERRTDG